MKLLRDTWLVYQRHMTLMLRSRTWLVFGLAQPITYLVLFAPMLKQALATTGADSYADAYLVYVPGLLVVMCLLGGLYTGFGLLAEVRAGIIERSRVTPVSRAALLLGRVLREVTTLLTQCAIITLVALPFGLRVRPEHVLLGFLVLALVGLMTTTLSYQVALMMRNEGALGPLINTVGQPLGLTAGVLLPLSLAPVWMQQLANWNPFSWATDAMRAVYAGAVTDPAVWQGILVIGVLSIATVVWSARLFGRTVR